MFERRRNIALLTGVAAVLVILNLLVAMAVTGVFAADDTQQAVAKNDLPPIVSVDAPAYVVADELLDAALPRSWRPSAGTEPGVVDLLQLGCGTDGHDTAVLAYHRPVRIHGKTVTAAVEVWPPGSGAAAINLYRERSANCWNDTVTIWSESRQVSGYPGVVVVIQSNGVGVQTLRWSIGDVTLSLTGSISGDNSAAAKAWTAHARKLLSPVCADLHPHPAAKLRSPWKEPDDYRGLLARTLVRVTRPTIIVDEPTRRPRLENLPVVEEPTPPLGVPIWPLALPRMIPHPTDPQRPKTPRFHQRVPYQVPDPVGPGCGWVFTASPVPEFSTAESELDRNDRVSAANTRLTDTAEQWAEDESSWRLQKDRYYGLAKKYRQYAVRVAKVADSWQQIRAAWSRYAALHEQWKGSVKANAKWKKRRKAAEADWPAKRCPEVSPSPTLEPTPSTSATPSPSPTCLAVKPRILNKTEPEVRSQPSKPSDPRPLHAR